MRKYDIDYKVKRLDGLRRFTVICDDITIAKQFLYEHLELSADFVDIISINAY